MVLIYNEELVNSTVLYSPSLAFATWTGTYKVSLFLPVFILYVKHTYILV